LPVVLAWVLMATQALAGPVLHRGNGPEAETLDPHRASSEPALWILYDLFEGLLTVDAAGNPVPGVAERWEVAEDGTTYRFHLRPDARWSDGTAVTAQDFVVAWRRLVDPATGAGYAFFLWPVLHGAAITRGEMPADALGVAAPAPDLLEVRLERPTAWFLSALQHPATVPLHRASLAAQGDRFVRPGTLVSNGAFILAEAVPQSHVTLMRNPHHRDAARVALEQVRFHITENRDTELKRFRAGELHITYDVPAGQMDWLRRSMADALRVAPMLGTYYYAINLTREPWASTPALRRALSLAIDRSVLVERIVGGGEIPAHHFVPDGAGGYRPAIPDHAGWTQAARNAEARRLLAEAGYGPGGRPLTLELLYNTSENHRRLAVAIAAMWQQTLGVTVGLRNEEWKVMVERLRSRTFADIARSSWIADYPDAESFLSIFRSDIGTQNYTGYANPAYDALLDAAAAERDGAKRLDLLRQAETVLLADQPVIPLYTHVTQNLVHPRVRGWVDNPRNLHLSRYLSLD